MQLRSKHQPTMYTRGTYNNRYEYPLQLKSSPSFQATHTRTSFCAFPVIFLLYILGTNNRAYASPFHAFPTISFPIYRSQTPSPADGALSKSHHRRGVAVRQGQARASLVVSASASTERLVHSVSHSDGVDPKAIHAPPSTAETTGKHNVECLANAQRQPGAEHQSGALLRPVCRDWVQHAE